MKISDSIQCRWEFVHICTFKYTVGYYINCYNIAKILLIMSIKNMNAIWPNNFTKNIWFIKMLLMHNDLWTEIYNAILIAKIF